MQSIRFAFRALVRDWRSGELMLLATAVLVAVAALSAVSFFTERVGSAVRAQASEALAADLSLRSTQPISDEYAALAAAAGLATARITGMTSVVFAGDANTLASVTAVSPTYPLRGRLRVADSVLGDTRQEAGAPGPGEAWASVRLLARLGIDVGQRIQVGNASFQVTRNLVYRPDEGLQFIDVSPTLLINLDDLPATGLIRPGSRVYYRLLFAGEDAAVDGFKSDLEAMISDGERLRDIDDVGPQVGQAMNRSQRFLNLSALISVLLAAVAVAMAARQYVSRHLDTIALLKALGASRAFVIRVNVIQLLMLSLIGGAAGVLIGFLAQAGLTWLLRDFVGGLLPPPGWGPVLLGMVTSATILTGFALPGFLQLGKTPPVRVLRRDTGPPELRYSVSYGAAIASMLLVLWWVVRDAGLLFRIAAGSLFTIILLLGAGRLLVSLLRGLRGAAGVSWRYGLANIARRGHESSVQVVAFGLGLMVLLLLTVVRNDLMASWRDALPEDAPNRFLINIQPDETEGVGRYLRDNAIAVPEFVPIVRARMSAINGTPVSEIEFGDSDDGERRATRDANLTWAARIRDDNKVIEGQWWDDTPIESPEISVEQEFAEDLGLSLGDELNFDVAGETVSGTVTSFRTVQWDSFQPNFFVVFSPGALEPYPATYITSMMVSEDEKRAMLGLMREFPSITIIDIDSILEQVRGVMDKAALAVQSVFLFTLAAGVVVLLAAVQATRDQRLFEAAILRTLGARRRQLLIGVASEFLVIGLLAGGLASLGASAAAWFLAETQFQLDYHFDPVLWITGMLLGMVVVGLSGMIATRSVISQPPINTLRQHG